MKRLKDIIKDSNRLFLEGDFDKKYLTDGLEHVYGKAEALVLPRNTEEVSRTLKFAYDNNINVTPRGAGTNLTGSTIPNSGIVMDLSLLNKIIELDKSTLTITLEPGVSLSKIQDYVESNGLFYPPDPGDRESSIGGNIATNAGGMRAIKYGVTRDYVQALELVLANGEIMELGSKNLKDSSGLSLKDLLIGSEGTLGIITKCILKLIPLPKYKKSIVVGFKSIKDAIRSINKIILDGSNPAAIEFVQRSVIKLGEEYTNGEFPFQNAKSYLILTYDSDTLENLNNNIERARNIVEGSGAIGFKPLTSKDEESLIWQIRGSLLNAVEAKSQSEPLDIVVPINLIDDFIEFIDDLEDRTGVKLVAFGHGGDGNIHICVLREDRNEEDWKKDLDIVLEEIYKKSYELGGLPSGEHGIGIYKKRFFKSLTDHENIRLMKEIKKVFDPKELLNSDKVYT